MVAAVLTPYISNIKYKNCAILSFDVLLFTVILNGAKRNEESQ
jgi:hypothetical protein